MEDLRTRYDLSYEDQLELWKESENAFEELKRQSTNPNYNMKGQSLSTIMTAMKDEFSLSGHTINRLIHNADKYLTTTMSYEILRNGVVDKGKIMKDTYTEIFRRVLVNLRSIKRQLNGMNYDFNRLVGDVSPEYTTEYMWHKHPDWQTPAQYARQLAKEQIVDSSNSQASNF